MQGILPYQIGSQARKVTFRCLRETLVECFCNHKIQNAITKKL